MLIPILTFLIFKIQFSNSNFLEAESNYHKPKLERNNIVNKGVWVKSKFDENLFEKTSFGNYFFKPNSLDVDNLLQSNFDLFAPNGVEEIPDVTSYVERTKRAPEYLRKHRPRKSLISKKTIKNSIEDAFTRSKVPEFRPLFNDYPFEISNLLHTDKRIENIKNDLTKENTTVNITNDTYVSTNGNIMNNDMNNNETNNEKYTKALDNVVKDKYNGNNMFETETVNDKNVNTLDNDIKDKYIDNNMFESDTESVKPFENGINNDSNAIPALKYNKYDYEIENSEDIKINFNKSERNKKNSDTYDKNISWQNAPMPETNIYEVVQKDDKSRVTERGLIKVISMLTKTFKKIMKQHTEIKQIHNKITKVSDDFVKQVDDIASKFQDYDSKYSDMIQIFDKLKKFENKMEIESENLKNKQKDMENNMLEFENQQKKFLTQQRQFYNIQKLMIAQNEKINLKQNMIAKTQAEISHRQNNFARILKKAKQIFIDNKPVNKTENQPKQITNKSVPTTPVPVSSHPTTDNVKINLFNIPTKTKIVENKDDLLLKEKDLPIDELVYKFYFNNTFIDGLMKSKILNNYATNSNSIEVARNTKNKREKEDTTLLLPINKGNSRKKRWIRHVSKRKHAHNKANNVDKIEKTTIMNLLKKESDVDESMNPFNKMARNFCNEIGQNTDPETFNWCFEKTLRRFNYMNDKVFAVTRVVSEPKKTEIMTEVPKFTNFETVPSTLMTPSTFSSVIPTTLLISTNIPSSTFESTVTPMYTVQALNENPEPTNLPTKRGAEIYFPDNDELESNLQQYELKPDEEGNVYYDGSLHSSDLGRHIVLPTESGENSDVMPGLAESDSKVEFDTFTFDLQAKRRAYVRRLNENILRQMKLKTNY